MSSNNLKLPNNLTNKLPTLNLKIPTELDIHQMLSGDIDDVEGIL